MMRLSGDDGVKVYLSGPMSGLREENYPAFDAVADRLKAAGFRVVNPAHLGRQMRAKMRETPTWDHYMRMSIVGMMVADVVLFLDGWENSKGAKIERELAMRLDMPLYYDFDEVVADFKDEIGARKAA